MHNAVMSTAHEVGIAVHSGVTQEVVPGAAVAHQIHSEQIVAGGVTQNHVEIPTQEIQEHFVDVPEVQVVERIEHVQHVVHKTQEHIVHRSVEHVVEVPVPQIHKELVHVEQIVHV